MSIMLSFSDGDILSWKRTFSKLLEVGAERIRPMPSPSLLIRIDREVDAFVLAIVRAHEVLQ